MRLCLEIGTQGEVEETIKEFVQIEKEKKSEWFKRHGRNFKKSYLKLDTTNLMHIIPRVTKINQFNESSSPLSLEYSLHQIKNIRNDVVHVNENVTYAEDTLKEISDLVDEIIDRLGELFEIESSKVVESKHSFHKEILDIKNNQKPQERKIIIAIQQEVRKQKHDGKWKRMIINSMNLEKHQFRTLKVSLNDIFYDTVYDVIKDYTNPVGYRDETLETIACKDILSSNDTININIIEGYPGSGKSAVLRLICHEFCSARGSTKFETLSSYAMIISISCQNKENIGSVWKYLQTYYEEITHIYPEKYVISALKQLKIIVTIDGLDESNEISTSLVNDVVNHFGDCKDARFLITSRSGFSNHFEKLCEMKGLTYRVLKIKTIDSIADQEQILRSIIAKLPDINKDKIIETFREKQIEFKTHFVRPPGIIQFISLFDLYPEKMHHLTNELDLMQLSYKQFLENMSDRIRKCVRHNYEEWSRLFMKNISRFSLKWIHHDIYEIDQNHFNELKDECFEIENVKKIPVYSIISCVFLERKCFEESNTVVRNFHHPRQQHYLASTIVTQRLCKSCSGTILEILQEITGQRTVEKDLRRLVQNDNSKSIKKQQIRFFGITDFVLS